MPDKQQKTRSYSLRVSLCFGSGVERLYLPLWFRASLNGGGVIIARKMSRTNLLPGYLGGPRVAGERLQASGQLPGC